MNFSARNLLSIALLCATLLSTTTVQAMEDSRTEICKESPCRETESDADLFFRCLLLAERGIYVNPQGDYYQVSPEELKAAAAAVNVKVPVMEKICEKCLRPGQGIREKNWMKDQMPLFRAASKGHIECLKKLSFRGVSLDEIDENGWSTLHHACFNGELDCVLFLLGAQVNPNSQNTLGVTPLHLCCTIHPECVNALLSSGAKPNIQDNSGETPLHRVCKDWAIRSVWFLLHCKANPNLQNKKGNTPLHHACEFNANQAVWALLNAGADVTIKNLEDKTPLEVAQEKGHTEVVETIKKFVEKKI